MRGWPTGTGCTILSSALHCGQTVCQLVLCCYAGLPLPGSHAHLGGLPGLCAGLGPRGVPPGLPKPSMGLPMVKEPGLPAGTARGGVDLVSGQPGVFSELLRLVLILAATAWSSGEHTTKTDAARKVPVDSIVAGMLRVSHVSVPGGGLRGRQEAGVPAKGLSLVWRR